MTERKSIYDWQEKVVCVIDMDCQVYWIVKKSNSRVVLTFQAFVSKKNKVPRSTLVRKVFDPYKVSLV